MEQRIEELRHLAHDKNIRDARKLYQYAKTLEIRDITQAIAAKALESSIPRQVLAPPPRYSGQFASSRPGQDIQADLIDFSKNTSSKLPHRYALVLADVFTRKLGIEPIKNKSAAVVEGAMQRELKKMGIDADHRPALIRTDQWKEFAAVAEASHNILQARDLRDTNALGIVDRGREHVRSGHTHAICSQCLL